VARGTSTNHSLRRRKFSFAARDVRRAVEAAYLAELPQRTGRVWAAIDAHQVPYWARGQLGRFQRGWAGTRGRPLRGYWLHAPAPPGAAVSQHAGELGGEDSQRPLVPAREARRAGLPPLQQAQLVPQQGDLEVFLARGSSSGGDEVRQEAERLCQHEPDHPPPAPRPRTAASSSKSGTSPVNGEVGAGVATRR
jgi:hypothetical protein